jgi:hypothetical protein
VEDIAAAAHEAIVSRDWAGVRHLLHPYLHWTRADGVVVRGRSKVLVMLQGDHSALGLPRGVELRDGQIYRWLT